MYVFSFAVKTGSFVYDVNIGLDNWQPSQVRISVCVYTCALLRMPATKYIGLARMKSLILQFFWEPLNLEKEVIWKLFNHYSSDS